MKLPFRSTPTSTHTTEAQSRDAALMLDPYTHVGTDRVEHPLTGRALMAGEPGEREVRALWSGALTVAQLPAPVKEQLLEQGWLVADSPALSTRFRLQYVSLEAHTVCNQACYFCPVSLAPREDYFMPTELYEDIVSQLTAYRDTLEGVIMINYNEPTVDKRFLDQVRLLKTKGLPPAVLTNGSGLTPARVDAIVELGGLRFLSVNLSTLDRERYQRERGVDQLGIVLRNLDYLKNLAVAQEMDMVVLGRGDDQHRRDYEQIAARFADSRFRVKYFEVMDRAGYLPVGLRPAQPHARLCGCDNVGSRPLQHLHITPRGQCVLCCEDYDEKYVVGDLTRQTVAEVLSGPELARLRRWVYGLEDAPADFICRHCIFARTR